MKTSFSFTDKCSNSDPEKTCKLILHKTSRNSTYIILLYASPHSTSLTYDIFDALNIWTICYFERFICAYYTKLETSYNVMKSY